MNALIDNPIAVLVDFVARFGGEGTYIGIVVVAIGGGRSISTGLGALGDRIGAFGGVSISIAIDVYGPHVVGNHAVIRIVD